MTQQRHSKVPITPFRQRLHRLFPFLRWWGFAGLDTLRGDLVAGFTGAVIVLPQGVAFAMIAGLPPEYGLYTAIVPPVVAALFGSSLHLISGPTTAVSIVVFTSLSPLAEPGSPEFIRLALTLTFLAGVFQLAFGLGRLGVLVNFVSHSVVVGFTAGAAVLIASSQMKHVFGLYIPAGTSFLGACKGMLNEIHNANPYVALVAVITLACAVSFKVVRPRWPGMLFALFIGSLTSLILGGESHGVPLIGKLPAHLPPLSLPLFAVNTLQELAPKALAVALLGLIEALSIARAISNYSRQQIDGNQEFIGQGLSNIVGSFFSSYAGSGSFTRSSLNYYAGAMTPLAAVFAAAFLMLMLLLVAPLTAYLPIPAMAGVILLVAYNLIDFHHIQSILRTSKEETAVVLTSFLATLLLNLEFAIYAGVLLSLILYLSRTSHPQIVNLAPDLDSDRVMLTQSELQCPNFRIIRIDGSLFFGAVSHIADFLYGMDKKSAYKSHVLIVACGINSIDVAGAEMLVQEAERRRKSRGELYLCSLKPQAREVLERGGYIDRIGKDHLFDSENEAILSILPRLDHADCHRCMRPLFKECKDVCSV